MQVHKEAEGHLVGFPHSLHLQTIRNLPTGFTLHVIYHIMKSSLQARGEMLKFLWRWFVIACFSLEFSGCSVTWWAVLTSCTCQPESDFSNAYGWGLWQSNASSDQHPDSRTTFTSWGCRELTDSGCEYCAFDLLKIQSLLWDGARGAVTNLISVRKITLTDFQW